MIFYQRLPITEKAILETNILKKYQHCKYKMQYYNDKTNTIIY